MSKNFSTYNFHEVNLPQFEEVFNNKDYVYYGNDNQFPLHLVDMYNFSAIHRTCLETRKWGTIGELLFTTPESEKRLVRANRFESVYDVFKKVVHDYLIFGGFALNIVWKRDRDLGIAEFYHIDFTKVRAGKPNEFDMVDKYYLCNDWKKARKNIITELPAFNKDAEKGSQVYYYNPYTPNRAVYPQPDYLGAYYPIQIDIQIKNHHLNNLQNSLLPSLMISFNNGEPSDEERDELYRQLNARFGGTNNSGKLFLSFNESKETAPEVVPINPSTNENFYDTIHGLIEQNILSSHRISSPMLVGIKTSGQLGGRQELLDAQEHFTNLVIKPNQNTLLREFENILFERDLQPIQLFIKQNSVITNE